MPLKPPASSPVPPTLLLACAGIVLGLSMGTRHVQGLFMLPLLAEHGWGRTSFSFALGLQVLVWGAVQPLAGYLADRRGTGQVIAAGCLLYAAGLVIEAWAPSTTMLALGAGLVVGVALTGTTFAVVYGALSRLVPAASRGTAQGVAGAIGGLIQFMLVPLCQVGIDGLGWSRTLQAMAAVIALSAATAWCLDDRRARTEAGAVGAMDAGASPRSVVGTALGHSGFWLLNLGFLSCGFQLAFLGAHLPAYLQDAGMDASAGVNAIALIAAANAVGTYVCGRLGDLYRRKYLLAGLYAVRTVAMLLFMALPLSNASLYGFALVMGATWLGTVPLTSGVIAQIFGVRYIGTLFGLVFLGHQLGGFLGAWLGGLVYDATRSYAWMWFISVGLGVASVLLHLPIRDQSVEHTGRPVLA
ncbi:MFS transporter [Pelomonas sp. Root1217]|uniref:MFS transporter n=1 Tax=Pelomonas sp. Root1217 TaxID=1736430 RepID=UPI00070FE82A|nr:MFS transporter [Pelomonas sp. Root1217]KQV60160.1 MFS transporter [Pelomonas sp. Root1217]